MPSRKGNIIYLSILGLLLIGLGLADYHAPKPVDWTVRYSPNDSQPYDTFVLAELLPDMLEKQDMRQSNQTIYELIEEGAEDQYIFVLAQYFYSDPGELASLLGWVKAGGKALIVADDMDEGLLEKFGLKTVNVAFETGPLDLGSMVNEDSILITWEEGAGEFLYPLDEFSVALDMIEEPEVSANVRQMASNDRGFPVAMDIEYGLGRLRLATVPMAFTNYFLLKTPNHAFPAGLLNGYLNGEAFAWTHYYQFGRRESDNPLRYLASQPALRWGYFVGLIGMVVFLLFQGKRKQRIIPILTPPSNDTVDFVTTVGRLYYERSNHTDLAKKKVVFWLEYLRNQYQLSVSELSSTNALRVASKSGKPIEDVKVLFNTAAAIQSSTSVSSAELTRLNKELEKFYAFQKDKQ